MGEEERKRKRKRKAGGIFLQVRGFYIFWWWRFDGRGDVDSLGCFFFFFFLFSRGEERRGEERERIKLDQ